MRKVYICSPYRAKDGAELDRNIDYAQQLTRQALEAGIRLGKLLEADPVHGFLKILPPHRL